MGLPAYHGFRHTARGKPTCHPYRPTTPAACAPTWAIRLRPPDQAFVRLLACLAPRVREGAEEACLW